MYRTKGRALLLGSLLWALAGCGEVVPGGAASVSGTVSAPTGGDVAGTRVFACYDNEPDCAVLAEVRLEGVGSSSAYQLGALAPGRYNIYARKSLAGEEYVGWYVEPGDLSEAPAQVIPPATDINIRMRAFSNVEHAQLPEKIRELDATQP